MVKSINRDEIVNIKDRQKSVYVSIGEYVDNQDGVFAYWPKSNSKEGFCRFLKGGDLVINLLTIGQQASGNYSDGEVFKVVEDNNSLIQNIAKKYFSELDGGINLNDSLFVNFIWSECKQLYDELDVEEEEPRREYILTTHHEGDYIVKYPVEGNMFIIKDMFEELVSDVKAYQEIFCG